MGWFRADPRRLDGLLAAVFLIVAVITLAVVPTSDTTDARDANVFAYLLAAGMTVPLIWRRLRPTPVLAISMLSMMISVTARFEEGPGTLATLIAVYSLAAFERSRRKAFVVGTVTVVAFSIFFVLGIVHEYDGANWLNLFANYIVFATAFILGDNVHRRRERVNDLEQRALALEHTRELETQQAVSAERSRIARELHDVIAHSVSVMVVQAGAARRIMAIDPERATTAMEQVELTGREALGEMRRLLGVLRDPDGEADRLPQPTLDQLPTLIGSDPTLPVHLAVEGESRALPAAVEVSAYRIIQEALANVRKHAGPTVAEIALSFGSDALEVRVDDHGRGGSTAWDETRAASTGHGLVGMAERASLLGGVVHAGPRPGGGWQVRATLPYEVVP